jgi:hypothetical protein
VLLANAAPALPNEAKDDREATPPLADRKPPREGVVSSPLAREETERWLLLSEDELLLFAADDRTEFTEGDREPGAAEGPPEADSVAGMLKAFGKPPAPAVAPAPWGRVGGCTLESGAWELPAKANAAADKAVPDETD